MLDLDDFAFLNKGGRTNWEDDHSHPFVINSDGTITIGLFNGHSHEVSETAEFILLKNSEDKLSKENPVNKTADTSIAGGKGDQSNTGGINMPHTKEIADLTKSVENLTANLAKASKFGSLNDIEKSFYATLDEDNQALFLEKSGSERQEEITASTASDPVIYKSLDGSEFRKSDNPQLIISAKRADALEKRLNSALEKTENQEFSKRAENELCHLPGTLEEKIATLKAIEAIPNENLRKKSLDMIKANNSNMSKAFENHGITKAEITNANSQLDNLAKKYAEDNGVTFAKAYSSVVNTLEGQKLYEQTVE